jgi:hypothetical protein
MVRGELLMTDIMRERMRMLLGCAIFAVVAPVVAVYMVWFMVRDKVVGR